MKEIKNVLGLSVGLIGLHYFYSFIILSRLLTKNELDLLPIISIDDITFPFGMINYSIISLSLSGFVWIYLWHLFVNNEEKKTNDSKDSLYTFRKKVVYFFTKKIFKKLTEERINNIFYLLLLITLCSFVLFIIMFNVLYKDWILIIMFLVNFLIIPIIYIYNKSKRNITILGYIGSSIIWSLYFINTSFSSIKNSKQSSIPSISFEYHNDTINSNKNYILIYSGYKYLIMKNDSTNICDLYPMSDVKKISYSNKENK